MKNGLVGHIDPNKTYKVLFIGNSFTFFNESWNIFKEFAKAKGIKVEVSEVTSGGYTLEQMASLDDQFGQKVDRFLLETPFDFVFMQEHSLRPITEKDRFFNAVKALKKKIVANGAQPVLYETWARKETHPDLQRLHLTYEQMAQGLFDSYAEVGKELSIPVSHAGKAFFWVHGKHPGINLYDNDDYHPSREGSYLIALTHFVTVFGVDPRGMEFKLFDDERQSIIEQGAYESALNL